MGADAERGRRAALERANVDGVEAFQAARVAEARVIWEGVARQLTRREDDWAPTLYENLGLAYYNLRCARPALVAFLRALDGNLASRQQSLRYAVACAVNSRRLEDARRLLRAYEAHFGTHPDGWSDGAIAGLARPRGGRPPGPANTENRSLLGEEHELGYSANDGEARARWPKE